VFHDSDDEDTSNNASEMAEVKGDHLSKEGSEDVQAMPASKKVSSIADEKDVKSSETDKDPNGEDSQTSGSNIDEDMIKAAIDKRASYFRENSEYVSTFSFCYLLLLMCASHQKLIRTSEISNYHMSD
jgi:hypothetical protein